jgi:hypothetical protein
LFNIGVVLSRPNPIFFFSLEVLNWRLIELQLVGVILVVPVGVDVGGYGRDGLVLVDIDEVL